MGLMDPNCGGAKNKGATPIGLKIEIQAIMGRPKTRGASLKGRILYHTHNFTHTLTSEIKVKLTHITPDYRKSESFTSARASRCGCSLITCNLNMIKHDYSCNLRHKTLHLCACYHTLSAFLSFYAYLCHNLKIH